LVLSNLRELNFQRFGYASVESSAGFAQQGAVRRVLHQRVLEQVAGMGRHALPEDQASLDQTVECG
jgi:hypothetical protein